MKDFHLRFGVNRHGWPERDVFDLLGHDALEERLEPSTNGAYVLGTADGTMLVYPWGSSPVFYIGSSENLLVRVGEHASHIREAIQDHTQNYWPRYQYGAAFGTHCALYHGEGRKIEADLINDFYGYFGAIPVANGAWPREG